MESLRASVKKAALQPNLFGIVTEYELVNTVLAEKRNTNAEFMSSLMNLLSSLWRNSSVDVHEVSPRIMNWAQWYSILPINSNRYHGKRENGFTYQISSPLRAGPISAQMMPRSGHRAWSNGSYLFVVGGYNPALSPENNLSSLLREVSENI